MREFPLYNTTLNYHMDKNFKILLFLMTRKIWMLPFVGNLSSKIVKIGLKNKNLIGYSHTTYYAHNAYIIEKNRYKFKYFRELWARYSTQ